MRKMAVVFALTLAISFVMGIVPMELGMEPLITKNEVIEHQNTYLNTRAVWTGTERNILWLRSDAIIDPNAYYLDVESRVQVPGQPNENRYDNAIVNTSYNSENNAIIFRYPRLNSTAPPITSSYISSITPYVYLYVNSHNRSGREIQVAIDFDMDGDGNYEHTAEFNSYVTKKRNQWEVAIFEFQGWKNGQEPSGQMTSGSVRLKIWRLDNITGGYATDEVQVYCGFYNLTSWIGIPFEVPDVMPVADIGPSGYDIDHMGFYWEGQDKIYFEFPVVLDASNSSDPQGQPLMYKWTIRNLDPRYDIEDKIDWTSHSKVSYTFHVPIMEANNKSYETNYSVVLQVRDPDEHYAQDTMIFHVCVIEDMAPVINITTRDIPNPVVAQKITFTCNAYDPDDPDNEMEFKWGFGDGEETQYISLKKGGNVVTHAYDSPGTYTVTVWVRDLYPKTVQDQITVEVLENAPPEPVITIISEGVDTNTIPGAAIVNQYQEIKVSAADTTDDGLPVMYYDNKKEHRLYYRWYTGQSDSYDSDTVVVDAEDENKDGDGWLTYTTFTFNYTSVSPTGYYTLKLEVADGDPDDTQGIVNIAETTMQIYVNRPPNAVIKYSPSNPDGIERNTEITFYANETTDPDDFDSLDTMYFRWEFGDGAKDEGYGKYTTTHKYTEEISPQQKYLLYTVKLTVYDAHRAVDTAEISIKIIPENKAPVAKATLGTITDDMGLTQMEVYTYEEFGLYGYMSYDQDVWGGGISHYYWDLNAEFDSDGDGIPDNDVDSEGENITFFYQRPGNYKINLIVEDNKGVKVSLKDSVGYYLEVRVYNQGPIAKLKVIEGTELQVGDLAHFDATDSYDPDNNTGPTKGIVAFKWDYDNDGSVDNITYDGKTVFEFKDSGTYTITVIVEDSDGETNQTSIEIVVTKPETKKKSEKSFIPAYETPMLIVALAIAIALFYIRRARF